MLLRKKLPLRILCLGLVLACCVVSPVQAITWDDVTDTFWLPADLITLGWHTAWNSDFLTWFDQSESDPGSFMFYWIYSVDNCPDSPLKHPHNPDYARHQFQTDDCTLTELFEGDYACIYCGLSFKKYREAIAAEADQWSSDYPYAEVTNDGLFTVQPSGWHFDWSFCQKQFLPDSCLESTEDGFVFSGPAFYDSPIDVSRYAAVVSASFSLAPGIYTLNLTDWDGYSTQYSSTSGSKYYFRLQGSNDGVNWKDVAAAYYGSGGVNSAQHYETVTFSTVDYSYTFYRVYDTFAGHHYGWNAGDTLSGSRSGFIECVQLLAADQSPPEDSRPSGIMDAIQQYNITHNYGDTNVINYYIGSFDEDDNLTGYYPMDIYDEETLVFSEPVTGAQYLTTGWRYDYAARRYTLNLEPGTFILGDYDILLIKLTYGDEAVTIQYYNDLGQLVETDEFQYVMVAKEQCTLNGHEYSFQTITESSCTSPGERLCTCAVCGHETVQEIPMLEHTGVYSVFQEATCTASGVGLMTCSRCGTQVSEDIPALGHDWLPVEDVETMYALPDGTSCPACTGVDFTAELDRINEVYSCSCASCGQIWTADAHVQHGYTKYECSRCGKVKTESKSQEDGLFASVGNLIADGIIWCTEKLTQLVDSLTGIVDTFTGYLDTLASTGGVFPSFLALLFSALPEELTSLIWLSLVGLVALLVWKKWLS